MVQQDAALARDMPMYDAADTFSSMLHAIDSRDWPGVRRAFADHVDVDYSSLSGAPAARVATDELIAGWQTFLGAFEVTQHLTGPIILTDRGESITANTHVRAYHRKPAQADGAIWLVVGHYEIRLARIGESWKITAMTLRVFYQEGSPAAA
jgi:hypothetical protein